MTAIAAMPTPYGFVIGADGMRTDTVDKTIVTEMAQKIFPIESGQFRLVFSWTGATTLVFSDGKMFDLIAATAQFFNNIGQLSFNEFADVISQFETFLRMAFIVFAQPLPAQYANSELARVLLLAYFEGQPCLAEISVNCVKGGTLQPKISKLNCPPNTQYVVFSGSERIYKQFAGDGIQMPDTCEKAIALIRDYVKLCVDNRDTDPECAGIGGHIHIGVLSPDKFEWIEAPRNVEIRSSPKRKSS